MKVARSSAEAHLYMDLHPCECGETAFGRRSKLVSREGRLVSVYEGNCASCGRTRSFELALSDEVPPKGPGVAYGGAQPSTIIDAGQFLAVADDRSMRAPSSGAGLSDDELAVATRLMEEAAAAVDEVLKFIPEGADAVPEEAFFAGGRPVYEAEPGRFRKSRLEAMRSEFLRVLARYRAH